MNLFRDMPVRRKLNAISMIAGGLALVVASLVFVAYDFFNVRAAFVRRVETLTEILSKQTTAALSFSDAKACEEILDSLSAETHILAAGVYDGRGRLFARFDRSGGGLLLTATEPTAEELGHFRGNPRHSETPGNLLSYHHTEVLPFLDAPQQRRLHQSVAAYLRSGELQQLGVHRGAGTKPAP